MESSTFMLVVNAIAALFVLSLGLGVVAIAVLYVVDVTQTRPLSKLKSWRLLRIVQSAQA